MFPSWLGVSLPCLASQKAATPPLIDFEREFEHRKTLLRLIVAITGGLCKQLTGLAYPV
jgi:hypothetical protein